MAARAVNLLLVAGALCAAAGCGSTASKPSREQQTFRTLAGLYQQYLAEHRRLPPNEAEFKKFIAKQGDKVLEASGVQTIDDLFVSSRDGRPIKVYYAKDAKKGGQLIAHEEIGVGGQWMIADKLGVVGLTDEAGLKELLASG